MICKQCGDEYIPDTTCAKSDIWCSECIETKDEHRYPTPPRAFLDARDGQWKIPLMNTAKLATIDADNASYLEQWRWHLSPEGAVVRIEDGEVIYMAGEVLRRAESN